MSALSALLSSMPQYHCGPHTASMPLRSPYGPHTIAASIRPYAIAASMQPVFYAAISLRPKVNPSVVVDICGTNRPNGDA